MTGLILHHYPPSPVAEKVRVGLGLKDLAWHSVEENRMPRRPQLLAMTGGYRRIPVLQVGSDIYCDTQCIFLELERRHPAPGFFPDGDRGRALALSRWTDELLFALAVRVSVSSAMDKMPPEVVADRARLYLGPGGSFEDERGDLPHTLAQLRPQLGWLDERLAATDAFLPGAEPGLQDLAAWTIAWFIHTRYPDAPRLFGACPALARWMGRMEAIGHGRPASMSPDEALAVARESEPETREQVDPDDPQGLRPGMTVRVRPAADSGDPAVEGAVLQASAERIALLREAPECGAVAVHFPRVGYRVTPVFP